PRSRPLAPKPARFLRNEDRLGRLARERAFRGTALASPTLPHVATFEPRSAALPPQRSEASGSGGLVRSRTTVSVGRGYARLNLPRSVLRKRDWSFFVLISRVSAACRVACGVLPAGLVQ